MPTSFPAVSIVFVPAAAGLFWLDGGTLGFAAFLLLHPVYGAIANTFWAGVVALLCVPLVLAPVYWDYTETPGWVIAAFAEFFYGLPLVIVGVAGRRYWNLRRRTALSGATGREDSTV